MSEPLPVGYSALIEMFDLTVMPYFKESYIIAKGTPRIERTEGREVQFYSKNYLRDDLSNPFTHIEFALKHEGMHLELLSALFQEMEKKELTAYVAAQPTGKTARKVWFLYEYIADKELPLKNAEGGSYVPLLDPEKYYTATPLRSKRHLVIDNLLGTVFFCPFVRRTEILASFEKKDLSKKTAQLIAAYDPLVINRAVNYLYDKETMSSFEIEHEKPTLSRKDRFINLLKRADHLGALSKGLLLDLQRAIVDPRFAASDYRDFQNFIGSLPRLDRYESRIDYIPPKPQDVPELMQGLLMSLQRMLENHTSPLVIAASIAFGFVFIHPFEDGNGRLHRFLMHYIFSKTDFVPHGAIFPISVAILKNLKIYDEVLESFSKPLLSLISRYSFDKEGHLSVKDKTDLHYRYIDFTLFAEYLFFCVEETIHTDFKNELEYLVNYDKVKPLLQEIVDMPDKYIDLFIQVVLQHGALSNKKRKAQFSMLTEAEIAEMEAIVLSQYKG